MEMSVAIELEIIILAVSELLGGQLETTLLKLVLLKYNENSFNQKMHIYYTHLMITKRYNKSSSIYLFKHKDCSDIF